MWCSPRRGEQLNPLAGCGRTPVAACAAKQHWRRSVRCAGQSIVPYRSLTICSTRCRRDYAARMSGCLQADTLMMVSGRLGFEIAQKALMAGIPIVASISAPSSLAVELANDFGMTAIGFLRGHSMNVYSHPERVTP